MLSSFVALATLLASVAAHGHVSLYNDGTTEWSGYNPQNGPTGPSPARPVHNTDNGFVSLPWGEDLVCGAKNAGESADQIATVAAGGEIEITWNTWPESHVGPVTDYLAACDGDCTTFETTTSTEWFAIQKYAMGASGDWLINGPTGINAGTGFKHVLKVPASTPSGMYVHRHEIVGLHSASNGEPQAYVTCYNLEVTGGPAALPAGTEFATFPASYADQAAFALNIYYPVPTSYDIPGPAVIGGSGGSAPAAPKPSAKPSSSVVAPKPSSSAVAPKPSSSVVAPKPSSSSVVAPAPSASSVPETPAEEPTTPEVPVEDAPIEEEEPVEETPVEVTTSAAAPAPSGSKPAAPKPETPSTPGSFADYNSCMKAMNDCKNKINQQPGGGERDFSSCEAIGSQCNSLRKRHMKKSLRSVH